MIFPIFLMALYVLLYAFVLVVIFLKIKQKERIHPLWFVALLVLTVLPIVLLYFIFSLNMPATTITTTVKEVIVPR